MSDGQTVCGRCFQVMHGPECANCDADDWTEINGGGVVTPDQEDELKKRRTKRTALRLYGSPSIKKMLGVKTLKRDTHNHMQTSCFKWLMFHYKLDQKGKPVRDGEGGYYHWIDKDTGDTTTPYEKITGIKPKKDYLK
jgi:hypothetical protein